MPLGHELTTISRNDIVHAPGLTSGLRPSAKRAAEVLFYVTRDAIEALLVPDADRELYRRIC